MSPTVEEDVFSLSDSMNPIRSVKDPIHDLIPLSSRICAIIDTKQFQRLRYVQQLGTSSYVWPAATHTRFEHSLGVMHLARLLVQHLQKSQPELGITDRDVECVAIAGLCHDLGHGPFSHVFDNEYIPRARPDIVWHHEHGSDMMLDYLIKDNGIDMDEDDIKFVKALIAGDPTKCAPGRNEKPYLFDIVANKRNGIDVDKFDYISRDSHMVGDGIKNHLLRLTTHSARVIDDQICYDYKDIDDIKMLCQTRYNLHSKIYSHKTAKAADHMVVDSMLLADSVLNISASIDNPRQFLYMTDEILRIIERSPDERLAPAQAIIDRLRVRDLYRMVDETAILWDDKALFKKKVTPEHVVAAAKKLFAAAEEPEVQKNVEELTPDHVSIAFSPMHHGMGPANPLHKVKFYSKRDPTKCYIPHEGNYGSVAPSVFGEYKLRVYTKDPQYFGIIQAAYRQVVESLKPGTAHASHDEGNDPENARTVVTPPSTPPSKNTALLPGGTLRKTYSNNEYTTVPVAAKYTGTPRGKSPTKKRSRMEETDGTDELLPSYSKKMKARA